MCDENCPLCSNGLIWTGGEPAQCPNPRHMPPQQPKKDVERKDRKP
ncbi:hypothetical protein [Longimycelium tulufanense]|nr:hypothetical protein [Longimycelium tulufanense]